MNLGFGLRLGAQLRGSTTLAGSGYVLWVVAGQSNAVSFAQNSPVTNFPSGALQISRAGSLSGSTTDNLLIAAEHPVDSVNSTFSGTPYNFADAFATNWLAAPANAGLTPVFLFAAEGATSIADGATWSADPSAGTRLADMVSRINTFFTNYPGATMGGFLWHQGEATADNNYLRLFEKMRAYVIANCPRVTGSTPWVVGGSVGGPPYTTSFLAQSYIETAIPYTAFVDTTGTTDVGDGIHFDKASLDAIGDEYWAQYLVAAASDDVNLGLDTAYGFRDFANNTWTAQGVTVTSITDGNNFAFPGGGAALQRAWQVIPIADLTILTRYRVRFTAERDNNTDAGMTFGVGSNQNFTTAAPNLSMTANTPTDFDFDFITSGAMSPNGCFFGVENNGGATATNLKITNLRVTRTIEE